MENPGEEVNNDTGLETPGGVSYLNAGKSSGRGQYNKIFTWKFQGGRG